MTDEEFRAWLAAPLSLAELLRIELAEACRQFGFIEATERADVLAADVAEQAMWQELAARADLAVLAEAAPNPYRERRRRRPLPSTSAMIRAVS